MNKSDCNAAFILTMLICFSASPGFAQSVQISVKTLDGNGVQSKVWKRVGELEQEEQTGPNGEKIFEGVSCSSNVKFKIKPLNRLSQYSPNGWVNCAPKLSFEVKPIRFGAATDAAISEEGTVVVPKFAASTNNFVLAEITRQIGLGNHALENGEIGNSAAVFNEMAALLRAVGLKEESLRYSAAAIELGSIVIVGDAGKVNPDIYTQVVDSGIRVESPDARAVLRDFQAEKGLTSAKWDYKTFNEIKSLDASSGDGL